MKVQIPIKLRRSYWENYFEYKRLKKQGWHYSVEKLGMVPPKESK